MKQVLAVFALALVILLVVAGGCFKISRGNLTVGSTGQLPQALTGNATPVPATTATTVTSAIVTRSLITTVTTAPTITTSCSSPYISCSGTCIHPALDNENCGKCGIICPTGQVCQNGICTLTCPEGKTTCSGICRDLSSDPANCGSCGTSCVKGQSCKGGTCISSCPQGQTMCTASAFAGATVCVNTLTDATHCGSCTNVCPSGWKCSGGKCVATGYVVVTTATKTTSPTLGGYILKRICTSGLALCGDTCVDLKTDSSNCGSCNKACAKNQYCVSGYCIDIIY
jgi:hypothetical protein